MTSKRSSLSESISLAIHSIRTRNALVTCVFLFLFLGVFYVGGRIVLANLVRDTASQVRDVGLRVSTRIQRQTDGVREAVAKALRSPQAETALPRDFLAADDAAFSFVANFTLGGTFLDGAVVSPRHRGAALAPAPAALTAGDFAEYAPVIRDWASAVAKAPKGETPLETLETGILRLGRGLHYAAFVRRECDLVLFGLPFSAESFASLEHDHGSNLDVRVGAPGTAGVTARNCAQRERRPGDRVIPKSSVRSRAGISPMFTETELEDADGSSWGFRTKQLETVFVLRDISGNAISELSVSLPRVFSAATRMAVWQLAFFVALGGIIFVLPIFWVQSRILLNPLTRMTRSIVALGEDESGGIECPRIVWKGKDEFAQLAESVNRLVEVIAARTVTLANVESRHKALIAGVPDALLICDGRGRLVSVTKQAEGVAPLPGCHMGSVPAAEVYGAESVDAYVRAAKETFRTGALGMVRLRSRATEGEPERHFEVRITRTDERHVLAIVRDVTEEAQEHARRLAAEERALDASKRESLTGFAAGIAHDMNNVLNVVLNTADAAEADPNDDKAKAVGTIRDAVRRGVSMMRELTTFAGESRMTFMRTDPQVILDDVRQIASQVVGDNIELTFEKKPGLPDVDVDLSQFWKVIFNIVKNAGEAIGKRPGHVALRALPFEMTRLTAAAFVSEKPLAEGRGALFEIIDDGPGISQELQRRIFDPYVSSKGLGRGLGLATVRTIVEAHGGGIEIVSRPDRGTMFRIYLPESKLPRAAPAPAAAPADAAPATSASLSGDILIVDDDASILKTMKILCKAMHLDAHTAQDRREALMDVRRNAATLRAIVLDAHLGSFDTVRLLGAFRLGAPKVPVIVASGSSAEAIEKMFKAHPYDAFLSKPYTITELKAALVKAVAAKRETR